MTNAPEVSVNSLPTLAILGGTGKEGPGLALRWASVGYPIIIGSRQAEKARKTAAELNQKIGRDVVRGLINAQAARNADICVLTVVHSAHQAAVESLAEDLQGKILVDATARVDFRNPMPPAPPSAARMAQKRLGPGVRVVAAFQNVPAHLLTEKLGESLKADVLVCSDDLDAARAVMQLAGDAGLHAYYAGDLDAAIVIEGLTAIAINLNKFYGVKTASIAVTGIPGDK